VETLWERVKNSLFEGAVIVAERAEHLGCVGRIKLDIANDKRLLQAAFADLGRRAYSLLSTGGAEIAQDSAAQDLTQRIRRLEETLREREAALVSLMRYGKSEEHPKNSEK
jgi:hypothetical protein